MIVELRKLVVLPALRNALLAVVGFTLLAIGLTAGFADEVRFAWEGPAIGAGLSANIAALVMGVWVFGVEAGERTLRRAALDEPDRRRMIAAKFGAALTSGALIGLVGSLLPFLASIVLAQFVGPGGSGTGDWDASDAAGTTLTIAFTATTGALLGASLGLLFGSMAMGITAALVLAFVVDGFLSFTVVGDYTWTGATTSIVNAMSGQDDPEIAVGPALGAMVGWLAVLGAAGVGRFLRQDLP